MIGLSDTNIISMAISVKTSGHFPHLIGSGAAAVTMVTVSQLFPVEVRFTTVQQSTSVKIDSVKWNYSIHFAHFLYF